MSGVNRGPVSVRERRPTTCPTLRARLTSANMSARWAVHRRGPQRSQKSDDVAATLLFDHAQWENGASAVIGAPTRALLRNSRTMGLCIRFVARRLTAKFVGCECSLTFAV